MNEQQLDNKIHQDTTQTKKDLGNLVDDGIAQLNELGSSVSQAADRVKAELSTWVDGSVSQLSERFEKLSGEAKQTVIKASEAVKKDVGEGLSQYNTKAQQVANRVPGNLSQKAAKYPWVAITIGLAVGLLLGSFLKPARQTHG